MTLLKSLLAVVLFTLAFSAGAEPTKLGSVESMLPSCKGIKLQADGAVYTDNKSDAELCWGAFLVIQRGASFMDRDGKMPWRACPPPDSSAFQLVSIFIAYADKHPERWHEDFTSVAIESLQIAFPCPGSRLR